MTFTNYFITFNRLRRYFRQRTLLVVMVIFACFVTNLSANAQVIEMHLFTLAPDWHGKEFCGSGAGYDPQPINAPSVSYSGMHSNKELAESQFNYSWQEKIDDGKWETVYSKKSATFISSYDPPVLYAKAGTPAMLYSWRLLVADDANGGKEFTSDEYSLSLMSDMVGEYMTSDVKEKLAINLTVNGGASLKRYHWASTDNNKVIPDQLVANEDPILPAGIYQVIIKDGVCKDLKMIVDTSKKHSE